VSLQIAKAHDFISLVERVLVFVYQDFTQLFHRCGEGAMDPVSGGGGVIGGQQPATGSAVVPEFGLPASSAIAAASTSAAINPGLPNLSNGDRGSDVTLLQESLSALGYNPGAADGIFGRGTESAVRAFQRDQGIGVDGIVGRGETWPGLLDSLNGRRDTLIQALADVPGSGFPVNNILAEIDRLDGLIGQISGESSGSGPGGTYTVQSGDTLSGIAQRHGVSLNDLLSANPQISNPNNIQVGQQINLPGGAGGTPGGENPGTGGTYTVRAGDTLSGIAARHGVSLNDLLSANPQISNPNNIQVGQQINLPAGATGGSSGTVGDADIDAIVQAVPADIRNAHPDNIAEHVERIVNVAQREGLTQEQTAYVLATATHESHLGRFLEELSSGAQYENRPDLGNNQPGDGVRFKGRGYVQLTGRANYQDWSNRLGVDLVGNPELAENPDIAAEILVRGMRDGTFTGRRLDRYINDTGTDFINARRVVNGTDRASLIAGYAADFNTALAQSSSSSATAAAPTAGSSAVSVGPEGSGADLLVKAGADIDNLDPRVRDTFGDIVAAWDAAGGPTPVITSGNDSRHSVGSLHFRDLAIDLRANNISDSLAQSIADDLARRLGSDFDVIFERFPNNPANDHIHLEYDPN
jgi:putative chitinase